MPPDLSIYIHIPFCKSRCNYCDFVTFAGMAQAYPEYVDMICEEIIQVSSRLTEVPRVHTIYFGGGTPSILEPKQIQKILTTVQKSFTLAEQVEITLEANPGTLSRGAFVAYQEMGINRISLGVQSVHQDELSLLGRIHTYAEVEQSARDLRSVGFNNLSLDLIYGLPGQSLSKWQESVQTLLELEPEHLSLYSLTIEEGTPLYTQVANGEVEEPDPDLAADQLTWSCTYLEQVGYHHYEISNWCKVKERCDYRSKHNLQYWKNDEYLGFGVGAFSYWRGLRIGNPDTLAKYYEHVHKLHNGEFNTGIFSPVDAAIVYEQMQDEMLLRLRMLDMGIDPDAFFQKFGVDARILFKDKINNLLDRGLLEWTNSNPPRLILTQRGFMLGNQVFMEFVGED